MTYKEEFSTLFVGDEEESEEGKYIENPDDEFDGNLGDEFDED